MKDCIKRMLTCVLALVMLLSLAACGSSGGETTKATESPASSPGDAPAAPADGEHPTIKVQITCLNVPKDVKMVKEAVSAITREKIGANVEFIMMEYANQTQQLNLLLSAGDDSIDVFYTSNLATAIANGQALDITDLIAPCALTLPPNSATPAWISWVPRTIWVF